MASPQHTAFLVPVGSAVASSHDYAEQEPDSNRLVDQAKLIKLEQREGTCAWHVAAYGFYAVCFMCICHRLTAGETHAKITDSNLHAKLGFLWGKHHCKGLMLYCTHTSK